MRKSCHEENRRLLEAYQLFQQGDLADSLAIYEGILDKTTNSELRANLICTMSVISTNLGNFNYAVEILEDNYPLLNELQPLSKIRYVSNLCFLHIITSQLQQSFSDIEALKEIVQNDCTPEAISFVLCLFFRVEALEVLSQEVELPASPSILESFYLLNLAFAKEMCGYGGGIQILKKIYPVFVTNKKMEFALICLRQLLLLPLSESELSKYEKQLGKLMSMGTLDNFELDISQALECCRSISKAIVAMCSLPEDAYKPKERVLLWKTVLRYERRKLHLNASIEQVEKSVIQQNICMMLEQKNPLVISEMAKADFFVNSQREIQATLAQLTRVLAKSHRSCLESGWLALQTNTTKISKSRSRSRLARSSIMQKSQQNRQNQPPLIPPAGQLRQVGLKSKERKSGSTRVAKISIFREGGEGRKPQNSKAISKMIRFCESGSFLSKRNYNSDGGQYRFIKVTNSAIKWGKNPEKIDQDCQVYPLKDIKSIGYGKLTPTLLKPSNHLLKAELCFSLQLQKRTLDFYCKDFEQVQNWVVGLSQKLRSVNPNARGYSVGRMLWKRMFLMIREKYVSSLPRYEKNYYYYTTAHAIILMGKNCP